MQAPGQAVVDQSRETKSSILFQAFREEVMRKSNEAQDSTIRSRNSGLSIIVSYRQSHRSTSILMRILQAIEQTSGKN